MDEVDELTADRCDELRELIQQSFADLPVESVGPIIGQFSQVIQRDTAGPARFRGRGRPAGAAEPAGQVGEIVGGDVDPEWPDRVVDVPGPQNRNNSGRLCSALWTRIRPMLETSARLLRLLSLLQSVRDLSGPQLSDRLEVSERTVRTDIEPSGPSGTR
jgi:HTH domain